MTKEVNVDLKAVQPTILTSCTETLSAEECGGGSCTCGSAHGAGSGGGCKCGSESGGGA
jgi:hypothetical protein